MVISATAMVIIFTVIFSELYQDNLRDKKRILFEDYGYALQNEFFMAKQTRPGYTRTFEVPQNLVGFDFQILIINNVLLLNYTDNIFPVSIPNITGYIQKGTNVIINENDTLCLNC